MKILNRYEPFRMRRKNNRKNTRGRHTQYIPYKDEQSGKIRHKCIKHER